MGGCPQRSELEFENGRLQPLVGANATIERGDHLHVSSNRPVGKQPRRPSVIIILKRSQGTG